MKFNPLIPLGTKINVDKSKINNLIPEKILDSLPQKISGKVIDYKMTDGMSIGYVLITENNKKIWIFNNELDSQTKNKYKLNNTDNLTYTNSQKTILGSIKVDYEMNGNKQIKTITNPLNLIYWLIYTLKDIF